MQDEFTERRKVAKDNTVQYHGKTLQIFPTPERTSYARTHVEVQARLDGRLLISYRGKVLSPGEAPLSPALLRNIPEDSVNKDLMETEEMDSPALLKQPEARIIWYVDPETKRAHRDLVKAGMERARKEGKRIGRPRVTEREGVALNLASVMERLKLGQISRRQAARELGIGYATLKRILDSQVLEKDGSSAIENAYAEVLN